MMSLYENYLAEIEERKKEGLHAKPIDGADLVSELIALIKDTSSPHRKDALNFFIYNTLPGTTSAAGVKAAFLKEIALGEAKLDEIDVAAAFEQLGHMKGGPSIKALLDIALGSDAALAKQAADVLKTQVFLYEADTDRLEEAFKAGNAIAKELIESYAKAEFFTKLPEIPKPSTSSATSPALATSRQTCSPRAAKRTAARTVSSTASASSTRRPRKSWLLSRSSIPTSASCSLPKRAPWASVLPACPA